MSEFYRSINARMPDDRGSSSFVQTQTLRDDMLKLFEQYNIKSIFDAGCNDCVWAHALAQYLDYQGGDISPSLIAEAWHWYPNLAVDIFDVTTDPIPLVDCVLMRDVAIHLVTADKKLAIQNWINSGVPWILMTNMEDNRVNTDGLYPNELFVSGINWCIDPWNFPKELDTLIDQSSTLQKRMNLWHRDQLESIILNT